MVKRLKVKFWGYTGGIPGGTPRNLKELTNFTLNKKEIEVD
jgi:hypothetical protein